MDKQPILIGCIDCRHVMRGPDTESALFATWHKRQCENCMQKSTLKPLYKDDGTLRRYQQPRTKPTV